MALIGSGQNKSAGGGGIWQQGAGLPAGQGLPDWGGGGHPIQGQGGGNPTWWTSSEVGEPHHQVEMGLAEGGIHTYGGGHNQGENGPGGPGGPGGQPNGAEENPWPTVGRDHQVS